MSRFVSLHATAIALAGMLALTVHAQRTEPGETASEPAPPEPTLALLSSGEEPKTQLRLAAQPGAEQAVVVRISTSEQALLNGRPAGSSDKPTIWCLVHTTVKSAQEDGTLNYALRIADAGVADEDSQHPLARRTKAGLDQLKEKTGTMVITTCGVVKSVNFEGNRLGGTGNLLSRLQQAIEDHLTVWLPEKPVGVGAKWTVSTPMKRYEVPIDEIATYTVTKVDGDTYTLDVNIEQIFDQEDLKKARMPQGQNLTLDTLSGKGGGTLTFNPAQPVVPSASIDFIERMETSRDTEQLGKITIGHVSKIGVTIEKPAEKSKDEDSKETQTNKSERDK